MQRVDFSFKCLDFNHFHNWKNKWLAKPQGYQERMASKDVNAKTTRLNHHLRPITDLKFNCDGDLLFTASKEVKIFVCNMEGVPLSEYETAGAVTSIAVSNGTERLASGDSGRTFTLWDVNTSKVLDTFEFGSTVGSVSFYPRSKDMVVFSCDDTYTAEPSIGIYDGRSQKVEVKFEPKTVPTSVIIDYFWHSMVYADTDGNVHKVDLRVNQMVEQRQIHKAKINRIRPSWCSTFFITASNDTGSKIVDFDTLDVKRSFITDEPVNDAVIFGTNDKALSAGGINARDVTLTQGGKNFDVCVFDVVTQKHVGSYSPHFGTINTVDIHPSCEYFCSGGEDASICLTKFGQDFYEASFVDIDGLCQST